VPSGNEISMWDYREIWQTGTHLLLSSVFNFVILHSVGEGCSPFTTQTTWNENMAKYAQNTKKLCHNR